MNINTIKKLIYPLQCLLVVVSFSALLSLSLPQANSPVYAAAKDEIKAGSDEAGGQNAGGKDKVVATIENVTGIVAFLVGLIAVLMIVIAGFRFVTSNGDSNTISSARNTILYAVIGIVITVMAYAIVNFILDSI